MFPRPPRSTLAHTLVPYTTLVRSPRFLRHPVAVADALDAPRDVQGKRPPHCRARRPMGVNVTFGSTVDPYGRDGRVRGGGRAVKKSPSGSVTGKPRASRRAFGAPQHEVFLLIQQSRPHAEEPAQAGVSKHEAGPTIFH